MDASKLKQVPRRSYRQMVADQLRDAIASGELAPGEHLNEVAVAKSLGVSPTPVREAFRDLEQAGLIVVTPHRGATVRLLTHRDLEEIYSLRAHLEQMAIRLAHPRLGPADYEHLANLIRRMEERAKAGDTAAVVELDVAFHRHIVERADHTLLLQTWERIHPSRWTYVTVRVLSERGPLYIARRHWPLLKALRSGSVGEAMEAAAEHIEFIGAEALGVLDDRPPSFVATETETPDVNASKT